MTIDNRQMADLITIAKDLKNNLIFTDRQCRSVDEVGQVFMILMFADDSSVAGLQQGILPQTMRI